MMKALLFAFALFVASVTPSTFAQQPHVVGEVTAVSQDGNRLTVKRDAGATVEIAVDNKTVFRRALPGQTSVRDAEPAARADVRAGDRVLVPNGAALAPGSPARQVILMAREAVAQRRDNEREDWRRRGLNGRVASVNAAKKEFTIEARGRGEAETVVVSAGGDKVRFRRYAPDSIRPADAVAGSFADIRVGDQVRVLGEREAARVAAEEVLSGSIARLRGTVESVDAAGGVVTLKDARTNQTVSVALGQRTSLRRLPEEFAAELRQRREQRREARQTERANNNGGAAEGRREGVRAGQGEGANRRRGEGGGRAGVRRGLEDMPAITLAELKRGDAVVVTATYGADATRLTAVSLITGDAEVISRMGGQRRGERDDMTTGLPGGVMGGNTGEQTQQQQPRRTEPK